VSETDISVLEAILEPSKLQSAPEMEDDEFFELFSAQKILRDYQLDPDDIDSGLVGTNAIRRRGSDGGIDGFYLFANGKIIRDLTEAENARSFFKKNVLVDVVILQASRQTGFTMERLTRLKDTCDDIFSLDKEARDFSEKYNDFLLDARERFRAIYRSLANKYPSYQIAFFTLRRVTQQTSLQILMARQPISARTFVDFCRT
jgi:hypothetical protein